MSKIVKELLPSFCVFNITRDHKKLQMIVKFQNQLNLQLFTYLFAKKISFNKITK